MSWKSEELSKISAKLSNLSLFEKLFQGLIFGSPLGAVSGCTISQSGGGFFAGGFAGALIGMGLGALLFVSKKEELEERETRLLEAIKEEEKRRLQDLEDETNKQRQESYRQEMIDLGNKSRTLFERTPACLNFAGIDLKSAETHFADRAFAPFWDSIESAVKYLGEASENISSIEKNSTRYTELIPLCESVPPAFPLESGSLAKLGTGTSVAEHMQAIVRKAQCDFQFATIYEQRRTNKILVAGFANLSDALNNMASRIEGVIDDLSRSMDGMASTLSEVHSRIGDVVDRMDEAAERESERYSEQSERIKEDAKETAKRESERVEREEKALKALDNIQRMKN